MTINTILQIGITLLRNNGISSPQQDTTLLLGHLLKLSKEQLIIQDNNSINATQEKQYFSMLQKRIQGVPTSKIIGYKYFWNEKFITDLNTLDPRSDSETLIELFQELYPNKQKPLTVLDAGTGSGCLIITILKLYQNATGTAIDINSRSTYIARKNAINIGVYNRLKLYTTSWVTTSRYQNRETFDVIISNPPYIANHEINQLQKEVRAYDPYKALSGGNNGLAHYPSLIKACQETSNNNGLLLCEIGRGQHIALTHLATQQGAKIIKWKKDLQGIKRCAAIKLHQI